MSRVTAGLGLTLAAAALGAMFAGGNGAIAAGAGGALGFVIQLMAGRLMAGQQGASLRQFMQRWALGMGLRFLGVVLVGMLIWLEPAKFPPLPAALGYVGVLVPLLFLEARRV